MTDFRVRAVRSGHYLLESYSVESEDRVIVTDTLSEAERSERMTRIRGKDSKPELALRRIVHQLGYRYRLHVTDLPGKPDLVFPKWNAVMFMHGCFWHRHEGCVLARWPKTRLDFWKPKLEANRNRDREIETQLNRLGWRTLVVWECELRDPDRVAGRVTSFLEEREGNEG